MRYLFSRCWAGLALLALLCLSTAPAQGQAVTDSLRVTIRGDLAAAEIGVVSEVNLNNMKIGQSAVLVAGAVDSDGDPVEAEFFWESLSPDTLQLTVLNDSTAQVTALHKAPGGVTVRLTATQPVEIQLAGFRGGEFDAWGTTTQYCDTDQAGVVTGNCTENYFCAYAVRGATLVFQSDLPPRCPVLFQVPPESSYPMSDRIRPFYALAANLRPAPD